MNVELITIEEIIIEKGGLPKNIPLEQAIIIEENDFPRVGRDVTTQETLVLSPVKGKTKLVKWD